MADPIWTGVILYGVIGLLVIVPFLAFGVDRIDHAAHGAYPVRALLLPGLVALWPIVAIRWATLERRRS